jgi:single-strand DNA-binding protein
MLKNNFQLLGHLGANPEIKVLENNTKIANFSVAVSDTYNGSKITNWFYLVAFGKTAEIIERFFVKGSLVLVSGKLSNDNYEDKDGIKKYKINFIVQEALLLSGGNPDGLEVVAEEIAG